MEQAIPWQPEPKTETEYKAMMEQMLEEMQRLNQKMQADQAEIERLDAETEIIKAEIDVIKARTQARLDTLAAMVLIWCGSNSSTFVNSSIRSNF